MAKINEGAFWINLLKKLLKQFLRKQGLNPAQKTKVQHVVPYQGEWAVKGEGNSRITSKHRYQDTAIRKARSLARRYGTSVVVHRSDGSIRDRFSP